MSIRKYEVQKMEWRLISFIIAILRLFDFKNVNKKLVLFLKASYLKISLKHSLPLHTALSIL
ncbi:MAG TPA: hypothetical protein VK021_02330, partial [Flavobacteriaceae bacterium]|nr:hypothetical protein [Flavobacteriaceae bacterium]